MALDRTIILTYIAQDQVYKYVCKGAYIDLCNLDLSRLAENPLAMDGLQESYGT